MSAAGEAKARRARRRAMARGRHSGAAYFVGATEAAA
jgi:hypothetical protein